MITGNGVNLNYVEKGAGERDYLFYSWLVGLFKALERSYGVASRKLPFLCY
jgi:hypothetical protein